VRAVVSRAGPHRGELFVAPARSFPCARVRTGTNVRLLCLHVTASVVCEREATHAALALGEASSCFVRSIGFLSRGLLAAARWTKFHGDKLITNVVVFFSPLRDTMCRPPSFGVWRGSRALAMLAMEVENLGCEPVSRGAEIVCGSVLLWVALCILIHGRPIYNRPPCTARR
jgi:hypothetical protein